MKKEFKAPIVEMRAFNSPEDIMLGIMLTSSGQGNDSKKVITLEDTAVEGFKQWKGFGK